MQEGRGWGKKSVFGYGLSAVSVGSMRMWIEHPDRGRQSGKQGKGTTAEHAAMRYMTSVWGRHRSRSCSRSRSPREAQLSGRSREVVEVEAVRPRGRKEAEKERGRPVESGEDSESS